MTKSEVLREAARDFEKSGNLARDVAVFLRLHNQSATIRHSGNVALEARKLAIRFGVDQESTTSAAWLHDISIIYPNEDRLLVAKALGISPLPEEEAFPLIIHQRISEVMAREIFGIKNASVLSAVGCHTTLKKNASGLDKVLFVADKIKWDQEGNPPYLNKILSALDVSLDMAAFSYLEFMWEKRNTLKIIHPWFREAYMQLAKKIKYESREATNS